MFYSYLRQLIHINQCNIENDESHSIDEVNEGRISHPHVDVDFRDRIEGTILDIIRLSH